MNASRELDSDGLGDGDDGSSSAGSGRSDISALFHILYTLQVNIYHLQQDLQFTSSVHFVSASSAQPRRRLARA